MESNKKIKHLEVYACAKLIEADYEASRTKETDNLDRFG